MATGNLEVMRGNPVKLMMIVRDGWLVGWTISVGTHVVEPLNVAMVMG